MLVMAGFLLCVSGQVFANDYLDALSSEAESTASIKKNSQLDSTEKEQIQKMESLLQAEKPSTYKYYVKLDRRKKVRAFKSFEEDQSVSEERLHHLQKKVMDLYFSQY